MDVHAHLSQSCCLCYKNQNLMFRLNCVYSKTCLKRPLKKRPKIGFSDLSLLNAGQKNCRMLQWEHSAILLTFIKLPFVIKICVVSIFEWPLKTGFTVLFLPLQENISCCVQAVSERTVSTIHKWAWWSYSFTYKIWTSTIFWYLSHRRAVKAPLSLQTCQSICCSHAQKVDVEEDSYQNLDL